MQGTSIQGELLQDAEEFLPINMTDWLQGERLVGIKADAAGAESMFLEVLHFAGERIHTLSWTATAGWQRATLHPADLIGFRWLEYRCSTAEHCTRNAYRIAHAERDTSRNSMVEHSDNGDIWLFAVEHASTTEDLAADAHDWTPVCKSEQGTSVSGLFVTGRWTRGGSFEPGGYTFSCTSGTIAKCVRSWGYKPWKRLFSASGRAVRLQPLHQACVRAARADYCGTGVSYTRNGTMVDMFDIYGFNVRNFATGFQEEAGFTPDGAAWVARKRWPTAEEDSSPWSTFTACRRPRHSLTAEGEQALIHVWSAPTSAQAEAGVASEALHPRIPADPYTAAVASQAPPRD